MLATDHQPAGELPGLTALKRMMAAMVEVFCDSFEAAPRRIPLEIDDSEDRVHGASNSRCSTPITTAAAFSRFKHIHADGGYQGPKMAKAVAKTGAWRLEIVKRSDLHRFVVFAQALDRRTDLRL